ncbi:MAG TPA: lysophospholipid acyltransferase family protein [Solirubrobacteraceae bacterium]|nr:lysophospholipid acyltransferase family protein [Solirubrobacteraceae bacterium]
MQILGTGLNALRATLETGLGDLVTPRADDPLDERDPEFIDATLEVYDALLKPYFRPEVRGLDKIPADGPVLLVGNHSGGTLIADTFVFAYAFIKHFGTDRLFHQLVHDVAVNLPMVARGLRKYGGLAAGHENAERALERGAALLVYPGGDFESYRPTWHQDKIEFGGRRGFLRLARKMDVPIVPVVAIGGQETALFVTRGQRIARATGWDRLTRIKVAPLQLAPPFGLTFLDLPTRIPLPAKITIQVLDPISLDDIDGKPAYDHVTGVMQDALTELDEERTLPIIG